MCMCKCNRNVKGKGKGKGRKLKEPAYIVRHRCLTVMFST
jgi:hypothetical protein